MTPEDLSLCKVMIVDDQSSTIQLLERILNRKGFSRITATDDPTRAVSLFLEEKPDLLLVDLYMPDLDGFALLAALRRADPEAMSHVPILMLTGECTRENKLRALEAGARDFIAKPFDPLELLARVRVNLELSVLHRRVLDQNRLLEERVASRTMELREAHLETVRRLARAAEFRDDVTGAHIVRISRYAVVLAEGLDMPPDFCELLLHASPLHDVGKIAIPDSILLKPGKLDPQEWDRMKTHAAIGARLLSGGRSPVLRLAEEIALTHHEKWNGEGYPRGLSGEDIPLSGRIVAVCDVFDALTSDRPYKKAWTVEDAAQEIRKGGGAHFDPRLVEAFDACLTRIEPIRDELAHMEKPPSAVDPSAVAGRVSNAAV
ncbi:MAG: response regulator [Armatimonadetes bacterium]|nr:response regulator [Armatimonadota bacterium]